MGVGVLIIVYSILHTFTLIFFEFTLMLSQLLFYVLTHLFGLLVKCKQFQLIYLWFVVIKSKYGIAFYKSRFMFQLPKDFNEAQIIYHMV